MAKARPRRKPVRRPSAKATARRGKKAPVRASKRKPVKRAAARRPSPGPAGASRAVAAEKARPRKLEEQSPQLPEIPPPLPAPIASFTF